MIKKGSLDGRTRVGSRPCAGCGKPIKSGMYCATCLEKLRQRAKVQGERIETLKTNALKRVAEERRELNVMIVNSDELNLNISKIVLERGLPECKIMAMNNPLSAINTLISREISLVILDADYNGLDMLRRIREDERFKEVAVMMMSSSTKREIVANVFSLGVQDYVTKPCEPRDLVERVDKMLGISESEGAGSEGNQKTSFSILLIDDDIFDLRQEKDTLQSRLPCEVTTAQSAVEGLKILENQGADLVLVSLDMPFVNGMKFLSFIDGNNKLKNIPVIIMTDTRDFSILSEISKSSAAGYVRKPDISEDGLTLIEERLRQRR